MLASPNKHKFFTSFYILLDIFAVAPFWLTILVNNSNYLITKSFEIEDAFSSKTPTSFSSSNNFGSTVLRALKLTRILRVLKLSRHVRALRMATRIMKECRSEIMVLFTCLAMNVVIFSCLIYYIELYTLGELSTFLSINLFL